MFVVRTTNEDVVGYQILTKACKYKPQDKAIRKSSVSENLQKTYNLMSLTALETAPFLVHEVK